MSLMCGSQDLTLQAILSNGVATVRQTLRRMFSAMAAERAKKRRKLVLTPVFDNNPLKSLASSFALPSDSNRAHRESENSSDRFTAVHD